jgi:hypothetical protein
MGSDIKSILERLALVEGATTPVSVKHGLNKQQKGVPQLPALFKPTDISPTLTKKPYQKHPMDGYMVGETVLSSVEDLRAKLKALQDIQMDPNTEKDPELKQAVMQRRADLEKEAKSRGLSEAMQEVEEDMLSKVKKDLNSYLDRLEQKIADDGNREKSTPTLDKLATKDKKDRDLIAKAVNAVEQGQTELDEDPTQDDTQVQLPSLPVEDPVLPECASMITLEDGAVFEIHECGPEEFEIRHGEKTLPTRFPNINHAKMAVDIFKSRKKMQQNKQQDLSQDYIEEK